MTSVIRYALAALLLLASSSSFAGTYWEVSGYFGTSASSAAQSKCSATSTCYNLCGVEAVLAADHTRVWYESSSNGTKCDNAGQPYPYGAYYDAYLINNSCPASLPYEWDDGTCQATEQCPVGTTDIGTGGVQDCAPICQQGYTRQEFVSLTDFTKDIIDVLGCTSTWRADNNPTTQNCRAVGEEFYCYANYTQDGQYNQNHPCEGSSQPKCYTPVGSSTPDETDESSAQEIPEPTVTQEYEKTPTTSTTNGDGSVTDEFTETTTDTQSQHTTVETIGDTVVVKDSSGTIVEIISQNTTNTYTDGSAQEVVTTTTTATPSTDTNTNVNTSTGDVTYTTGYSGLSGSKTTVVTKNYDSNGSLTSSNSQTSGGVQDVTGSGQNGEGEGEGGQGNCGAPDQPVCDVKIVDTTDEFQDQLNQLNQWQADLEAQRQAVVDELSDTNNDYGASTVDNFSVQSLVTDMLSLPSGGTCAGINTTFLDGKVFNFEPCEDLIPLREVLAWVFFILTLYAAINIVLGRRLF